MPPIKTYVFKHKILLGFEITIQAYSLDSAKNQLKISVKDPDSFKLLENE